MPDSVEFPADASSSRSLEILQAEHRQIEQVMRLFEAAIDRLRLGKPVPVELLRDTVDFFQQFADIQHHAKEERRLFPLLADHGVGEEMSAVHALLSQHDTGRAYVRDMRYALGRMSGGDRFATITLIATATAYLELLREHIRIEDLYVYPLASQHLTPAEDALLCRQFADYSRRHETAEDRERRARMMSAYDALATKAQS